MRERTWDRALVVLSRWRVDVAWLGLLALPWAQPTGSSIALGLPVLAAGVALRVWARGHLERAEMVTTSGPYAHLRHPLYVGSFAIAVAFALMTRLAFLPPFVALAFVAMYVPKALREEAYLRRRFGAAYAAYADRVGAVIPTWHAIATPPSTRFAWQRVWRHREWHTWVGVAALLAVMCGLAAHDPRRPETAANVAHRRQPHPGVRTSQLDAHLAP